MENPKWKKFELSVANFVSALDRSAKVTHDAKLPDIHTKQIRQRDVWVEAKVCHHFPVKVLISCKRKGRKLNQQDIDAFNGELLSSGAQLGVVYSFSGFAKNAILKAKKLGISCCSIYENEPANIPIDIVFAKSYCCTPRMKLSVVSPIDSYWHLKTWNDLFMLTFGGEGEKISALDAIVNTYFSGEQLAKQEVSGEKLFPQNWMRLLELIEDIPSKPSIKILIRGLWNIYEGSLKAHLLNGSYNFVTNEFIGSIIGPSIDLQCVSPGAGWMLLKQRPANDSKKFLFKSSCILSGGNAREALIHNLSSKAIALEEIDLNKLKAL